MCIPTAIPPETHILYKPSMCTHVVWQKILNAKGNVDNITRFFNLFPAIEAHIENVIAVHLSRNIINDHIQDSDVLQDLFVKIQI